MLQDKKYIEGQSGIIEIKNISPDVVEVNIFIYLVMLLDVK